MADPSRMRVTCRRRSAVCNVSVCRRVSELQDKSFMTFSLVRRLRATERNSELVVVRGMRSSHDNRSTMIDKTSGGMYRPAMVPIDLDS